MKKYYPLLRSLHLYFGLFISPFVLIFSISVLVFNHPQLINFISPVKPMGEVKTKLDKIPYDTTDLLTARAIIQKLGIKGEVDFINQNDDRMGYTTNTVIPMRLGSKKKPTHFHFCQPMLPAIQ